MLSNGQVLLPYMRNPRYLQVLPSPSSHLRRLQQGCYWLNKVFQTQ